MPPELLQVQVQDFVWFKLLASKVGEREQPGAGSNPWIAECLSLVNLSGKDDSTTAWCSAAVNWSMVRSGKEGTGSAAARSWLKWGWACKQPVRGCVVVFSRPPHTWTGHVGLWVRETSTHVYVLGGNQSNQVSVFPYAKSRLLGYRLPVVDSAEVRLA